MIVAASAASALAFALIGHVVHNRHRWKPVSERPRPTMAGLDVTPLQFWSTVGATAAATFVVFLGLTGLAAVSLIPAIVVATLPRAYFAKKRSQRLRLVQAAWPDGLRDLLASVRSGASLPNAIESMASFGPEPLREVFQGFDIYARSIGVVPALEMIREDLADPTSDRVLEVLVLAYERGGAVVPEILGDLADAATRDLWTLEQIRTEALEQKINSRVVFVLPWLVLVAITARPGPFRDFYATSAGILVVFVGGVLSLVGVVLASRLGRQPVEPRVFRGAR